MHPQVEPRRVPPGRPSPVRPRGRRTIAAAGGLPGARR